MVLSFALQEVDSNKVVYLASDDGAATVATNIPNDGGATPDLTTDTSGVGGPVSRLIRARTFGVGSVIPAGALSAAQAQAIFEGIDAGGTILTNRNVPRCNIKLQPRSGDGSWFAQATVDGQGDPVIEVDHTGAVISEALVTLEFSHTLAE